MGRSGTLSARMDRKPGMQAFRKDEQGPPTKWRWPCNRPEKECDEARSPEHYRRLLEQTSITLLTSSVIDLCTVTINAPYSTWTRSLVTARTDDQRQSLNKLSLLRAKNAASGKPRFHSGTR